MRVRAALANGLRMQDRLMASIFGIHLNLGREAVDIYCFNVFSVLTFICIIVLRWLFLFFDHYIDYYWLSPWLWYWLCCDYELSIKFLIYWQLSKWFWLLIFNSLLFWLLCWWLHVSLLIASDYYCKYYSEFSWPYPLYRFL